MGSMKPPNLKEQFKAFQSTARLDVLIPDLAEDELPDRLEEALATDLADIPARRNLFFDENAALILVLKTSLDEDRLKELIPNLEIELSAHATDAVPQGSGNAASASGKHDLTASTIPGSALLTTIPAEDLTFAIWKPTVNLPRPRVRLQRPAVYFTAYLNLSSEALVTEQKREAQFLEPYEPLPANLLVPLRFDTAMENSNDYISADLLMKGPPPAMDLYDGLRPVRGASKRAFPIIPALSTRIRYSKIPNAVMASLHIETSRLVPGIAQIQTLILNIPTANVKDLGSVSLPIVTKSGDELMALYKLTPKENEDASACPVRVKITAKLLQERRADVDIVLKWQTQVDLSKTRLEKSYKWSRPLSSSAQVPPRPPSSKEKQKPAMTGLGNTCSTRGLGIIFNFKAPHTVFANTPFKLHVQCVNDTTQTRRFALVALQPRKSNKEQAQTSDFSNASLVAKLFNSPPLESTNPPDVVDLNPDVRVGSLPPDTSYETDMVFRAMRTGVLDLGAIRIVDLDSRRTVDVRDLPDVVALEASDEVDATQQARVDEANRVLDN